MGKVKNSWEDFFEKYPQYQEDAFIASKMPSWLIESQKDMEYYLESAVEVFEDGKT